ncbi:MAG TPA: multiheme c-type cytochrome [Acidobacteriaceae bacterium]|jgi:hypothetical protein|nr:multiheme c-type cytochrome [Acidobacteriaceae bacterium]
MPRPGNKLIRRAHLSAVSLLLLLALGSFFAAPGVASQQQESPEVASAPLHGPPLANDYAGDAACAQCHEKENQSYQTDPHRLDSAIATPDTVLGDFTPGKNVVRTKNPNLIFTMIKADDGYYQAAVDIANPERLSGIAERFDIVVGSGRKGQTALYWKGDQLLQMPITYWGLTHTWVNSPGYPDGQVHFERPIIPRCLECHTTWFEALAPPNHYERENMILGIGCEKCHGPGREHVERESSAHPPAPGSPEEAIVNPARLSRDRQIDVCALCHAGVGDSLQPPLSFRPGDVLADYIEIHPPPSDQPVDVHGNQVIALERSKCFASGKLSCSTCHNVHEKQENADSYSVHCLECHQVQACGRYRELGETIQARCVECHMPEDKSTFLHSNTGGKVLEPVLRQHRIAIYPDKPVPTS